MTHRRQFLHLAAAAATVPAVSRFARAQSGEPIKIGFSMAMTGGLAANGKSALLAQKIWEEDINAKGGLLGRPVKLIYYDDQSNPATVPGIYTRAAWEGVIEKAIDDAVKDQHVEGDWVLAGDLPTARTGASAVEGAVNAAQDDWRWTLRAAANRPSALPASGACSRRCATAWRSGADCLSA